MLAALLAAIGMYLLTDTVGQALVENIYMSESAQNSAVTAMRRVDQPEPAVVECASCVLCVEVAMCGLRFFHPDYTVGPGISPGQPRIRGSRTSGPAPATVRLRSRYRQWGISPRPETDAADYIT